MEQFLKEYHLIDQEILSNSLQFVFMPLVNCKISGSKFICVKRLFAALQSLNPGLPKA